MKSFSELSLSPSLMQAISDIGYETPSPIQQSALPILLGDSTDFLGLAATGTGKTAAFALPVLEKIDPKDKNTQALVLCPTRELALQVMRQFEALGKYIDIQSLCVYGGASYGPQLRGLREGAQVVVGTPGRIVDMMERGDLRLDKVKTLILDEADEMVSMGFKDELESVLDRIPRETGNIWLFSATMGKRVRSVAEKYLRNPQQIQINKTEVLPSQIHQYYFITKESNKPDVLCKLMDFAQNFYGIIFCQTKQMVMDLTQYLSERGYKADSLHGDKSQDAREHSMQAFRQRKLEVLVCTDVASRGLDVNDVSHVINYSIPRETEVYVHRIGRTGRSGKTGIALSLISPKQKGRLKAIEAHTKIPIKEGRVPSKKEIGMKMIRSFYEDFNQTPYHQKAQELFGEEWQESLNAMSKEEIAGRFLSIIFPDIFKESPSKANRESFASEGGSDRSRSDKPRSDKARSDRPRSDRPRRGDKPKKSADSASRPSGAPSRPSIGERKSEERKSDSGKKKSGKSRFFEAGKKGRKPKDKKSAQRGSR